MLKEVKVGISAVDHFTAPLNKMSAAVERLSAPLRRIEARAVAMRNAFGRLSSAAGLDRLSASAGRLAGSMGKVASATMASADGLARASRSMMRISALAAVAGAAVTAPTVGAFRSAADFEQLQMGLRNVEGSAARVQAAMGWIQTFSAKNAIFSVEQTTAAWTKLRTAGLDPTKGLMAAVGNMAAVTGKPMEDAASAIADAMKGSLDKLGEFGVEAEKIGGKIVYKWENPDRKKMQMSVGEKDKKRQQEALQAIMAQRFGGGMAAAGDTANGLLARLSSGWKYFQKLVMDSGPFERIKGVLRGLVEGVERWTKDGQMQAWASAVGGAIERAVVGVRDFLFGARQAGSALTINDDGFIARLPGLIDGWSASLSSAWAWVKRVTDYVGGPLNGVLITLGAAIGGPIIAAIASLTAATYSFGVALMTTPVGWIVAGLAAVAGAAYLVYANWETITAAVARFDARVQEALGFSPLAAISAAWDGVTGYFSGLFDRILGAFDQGFLVGLTSLITAFNPAKLLFDALNGIVAMITGFDLKAVGAAWIQGLIDGVVEKFNLLTSFVAEKFNSLVSMLPDWAAEKMGIGKITAPTLAAGSGAISSPAAATAPAERMAAAVAAATAPAERMAAATSGPWGGRPSVAGASAAPVVGVAAMTAPSVAGASAGAAAPAGGGAKSVSVDVRPNINVTVQGNADLPALTAAIRGVVAEMAEQTNYAARSALYDGV